MATRPGDAVLRHVGQRLAASVRSVDVAGRYGGEEFLVVLPETGAGRRRVAGREAAARRRRRARCGCPDGELVSVTLSAGVAGGQGEVLDARRAGPRRGRGPLLGEGARPRPGLRLPRDRRRRHGAPRADQLRGPLAGARRRPLRDGRRAGRPDRCARRPRGLVGQAVHDDRRGVGGPGPRGRPAVNGELERIRTASLLHDLGKLAIPEDILARPGDLAISEWRVVTEHPEDRPGRARAGGRAARRRHDRAPPPRVVRRPRLSPRSHRRATSRSAPGSCPSSTRTRR